MSLMKKWIFGFVAVMLMTVTVDAQDAKKLAKDADRALGKFNLDQSANKAELTEAVALADQAVEADPNMGRAWNTRGDVYAAIATQIVTDRQLGVGLTEGLPEVDMPAMKAYQSYLNGLEKAEKNFETKDAVKGLQSLMGTMSNKGIFHYEDQEYGKAYLLFDGMLNLHQKLTDIGEESGLKEEDYNRQIYLTALAAYNANMLDEAGMMFQKLYDMEYDEPLIYEAFYDIKSKQTSPQEAYSILEKGKEIYPDNVSLLFAEINHYLQLGQSDKLIEKLEKAIEAEPDNASLYSVMGNAYETLYNRSIEQGDTTQADQQFAQALDYYNQAMEKNPQNITAIYSAGALYYNKAAKLTQEMLKLQDDYSKEGIEKYNQMRELVLAEFDKALPYFKKAEQIDPNDLNTLIALKEIYAKKDDLEMSNIFKERLETVQAGGQNEASYFKNN